MIDTLNATLYLNSQNQYKIHSLIQSMQSSHENFVTGKRTYRGNIRNIKIKVDEHRLRIEGSLAKFHLGNNIQSLTQESTKLAIEELSDCLSLSMQDAQVNRLDLAQTLSMKYPATSYYPYFGERPRMQRLEQGKGLYYRNTLGERVLYDKTFEIKKIKVVYPEFDKMNLMRFEVRHPGHKNLCKQLNMSEVTMGKLCDPVVYRGLIDNWATEYDKIDKYDDIPFFEDEVFRMPAKFCTQITYSGVKQYGGQNALMSLAKQAKERGVFQTSQQYSALKRKIRQMGKIKNIQIENPMINEVNTKVIDVLKFAF